MNTYIKSLIVISVAVVTLFAFGAPAFAQMTPTLSASTDSTGYNVTYSIANADPYAQVSLYIRQGAGNAWTVTTNFAETSGNGYVTITRAIGSNGSTVPVDTYVTVDGVPSNIVEVNPSNTYTNGNSNCYYSGNQYICGNTGSGTITFSQQNPTLSVGQSLTETLSLSNYSYYASPAYYLSNNSNTSVVSASVNGSTLNLIGESAGSSTLTVCANSAYSGCTQLYVTVSGYTGSSSTITFSQQNPTLSVGQSLIETLSESNTNYYYNYSYYLSNNSNTSVVSASVNGSTLNLVGESAGSTTLTICANSSGASCAELYVTVSGYSTTTGTITLSQNNLDLIIGQPQTVTAYNQASYNTAAELYISSISNPSVVSATVSGNSIIVNPINIGTASIYICQNQYNNSYTEPTNGCATLYVSVNQSNGYGYQNNNQVTFSTGNAIVTVNQTQQVTLSSQYTSEYNQYGNTYYISQNTNSSVVNASVSDNTLLLQGLAAGTGTVTVCQTNNSEYCGTLPYTVSLYGYSGQGGSVLGSNTYANGTLISENGTISLVYKDQKVSFANLFTFTGLGYNLANVQTVNYTNLPVALVISSPYRAHPWGTWIQSGSTVYFVSEYGLIPVADYNTFLSNGGQPQIIVQANAYDFTLPIQSIMTYNDSRLQ